MFYVRIGRTLPEVYHSALGVLYSFARHIDAPDWNTERLEVQMCMVVEEPLAEPMISKFTICDPKSLEQYRLEMLDGILDWSIDAGLEPYTYHDRIMKQYEQCIDELKRNPHTTRACINVRTQDDSGSSDPACLQHIQFMIRNGKLDMTVLFRSNDAVKATFMNAFALIMIQKKVADEVGVPVGRYTHIANSFHCYKEDYESLNNFMNHFYETEDETELCYEYVGDWKEMMDEEREGIIQNMNNLKSRYESCDSHE